MVLLAATELQLASANHVNSALSSPESGPPLFENAVTTGRALLKDICDLTAKVVKSSLTFKVCQLIFESIVKPARH